MSNTISGSTSISGLMSDVDFQTTLDQLYEIESTQVNQLIQWRSDWTNRLAAFQELKSSLVKMQTALTALNTPAKFLTKLASSSNSNVASATTTDTSSTGSYSVQVNQLATTSTWSMSTDYSSKSDVINDTGSMGTFNYSYKGKSYEVKVPSGTSLEGLKNLINNDSKNPGVKVQLIQSSDSVVFQMSGMDTGASSVLTIDGTTNITGLEINATPTWSGAGTNSTTMAAKYSSGTTVLNNTETPKTFVFSVNGDEYKVKLEAGGTLNDLVAAIDDKMAEEGLTDVQAWLYDNGDGTVSLNLESTNTADEITVNGGTLSGFSGRDKVTNWQVQDSKNAEISVNGWPETGWLEVESNQVEGVIDGLVVNLRDTGYSIISVELDNSQIQENVQTFVDSVNEVRSLLQSLTAVDDSKQTIDPDYAEAQYEMQKGSALTGNYGVQLLSSNLKSAIAAQCLGFTKDSYNYLSLSQIGIRTDAVESSETFGLLTIDSLGELGDTLEKALEKDPEGVAMLFSANGVGTTDSSSFALNSLIQSMTKPGTYDVSYTTDANGEITSATINGKEARIDNENRQIGLYEYGDAAGGIVLDIYDLSPDSTINGHVSVQQGKINEILDMLNGSEGILGEDGVLNILEQNYNTIIDNIDKKITEEDKRLTNWYSRMKDKFSRLEEVLANYSGIQSSLDYQLEQLKSK